MRRTVLVWGICLMASAALAQPPGGGGGQRSPMIPEQQAALAAKRQAEMSAPRPIEALDSVWFLSQATYRGVLTDMAESLRGMGFTTVILMGDSGGNQKPMQEVVSALNTKYNGSPARFHYIAEYTL